LNGPVLCGWGLIATLSLVGSLYEEGSVTGALMLKAGWGLYHHADLGLDGFPE
jgi:hypothetical protein